MKMFALENEVQQLAAQVGDAGRNDEPVDSDTMIKLAWYLRQSHTQQALDLLQRVQTLATTAPISPILATRMTLIHAEAYWLKGDYDTAYLWAQRALRAFQEQDNLIGMADTHWLLGNIALDRGSVSLREQERRHSAELAGRAGDKVRLTVAQAGLAIEALMRNTQAALDEWTPRLPDPQDETLDPCARAWVNDFYGVAASGHSDFGQAALYWIQANEDALRTGQIKRAIVSATNIGDAFNCLNEHQGALEWMERGLALAQQHNWPSSLALSQLQTAETMRRLGRLDAAQTLLKDALAQLEKFNSSRNYVSALTCLAELHLNQRDWQGALVIFRQLQDHADALCHIDFQVSARRGQAHALAQLGHTAQALQIAHTSLSMAEAAHDIYRQMDACCVLAEIHAADNSEPVLPQPENMRGQSPAMHYWLQALQLAHSIEGFIPGAGLLTDLAREYARHGDYAAAWRLAEEAAQAREKIYNKEATQRAIAMQIQHQTTQARVEHEKARAEIEHHQQMAHVEAQRAAALQTNSETLERLSIIGQEITAHLDMSVVFETLNRHVHALLDVSTFIILLVSPDGQRLVPAYSRENGAVVLTFDVPADDPYADSARCYREHSEILHDYPPGENAPNLIPGSLVTRTALFAPLAIGEQILGVMSIQSMKSAAYGARERLIFRTLCAYGAIALDNAHAYRQLQQAQNHLVAQEKLAALGAMVAGVAHELNTPLGNCLMITSSLQEKACRFAQKIAAPALQRSDLQEFMEDVEQAGLVLMRGLSSAADLVSSFKQVAVDRTTAQRRRFELQQTCHEIISTMKNQIRVKGHQISLDVPADIWLESYPGPLGQVITNLINNAMLHAFEQRQGNMHLCARQRQQERVEICFSDDGLGISAHNLRHIFDPFFTTKMGQGGTGLGLSISFNIVTSLLGGQISVQSELGQGTVFTLDLPLQTAAPPL